MDMPEYKPPTLEEELKWRKESAESRARQAKIDVATESHDVAGFETAMTDFSEFDDGNGNKVMHGDLSVQRMYQRDGRGPGYLTPLSTEKKVKAEDVE